MPRFIRLLDLESPYLVYKDEMGYGSDFQIFYSYGVGVGMSCLIASKCLGIPYDQFEPIPGPETRFDYRGESRDLRCVIESRGTKYKDTQYSQVEGGIEKKATCKKRGDKFDIGLVVSTCIRLKPERPRIIIADPKYSGTMFGKSSEIYYRYRHFVRVMQFIGATPLSRALFVESNNILRGKQSEQFYFKNQDFNTTEEMAEIEVDNLVYIGRWIDDWIPKESFRYRRLRSIKLPSPLKSRPKMKLSVFQGLSYMNFQAIMYGGVEDITITTGEKLASIRETKNGDIASVFPDGTILVFKEHS